MIYELDSFFCGQDEELHDLQSEYSIIINYWKASWFIAVGARNNFPKISIANFFLIDGNFQQELSPNEQLLCFVIKLTRSHEKCP